MISKLRSTLRLNRNIKPKFGGTSVESFHGLITFKFRLVFMAFWRFSVSLWLSSTPPSIKRKDYSLLNRQQNGYFFVDNGSKLIHLKQNQVTAGTFADANSLMFYLENLIMHLRKDELLLVPKKYGQEVFLSKQYWLWARSFITLGLCYSVPWRMLSPLIPALCSGC